MKPYIAVVEKDTDSAFGLWFPDLPGCFSAADHEDDIIANAIEAINLHLDGQEDPQAQGVDQVASQSDVKQALQRGAYLLAIPRLTQRKRSVRVNVTMDKGELDAIDAAAKQRGLTRSAFIVEATQNEIRGR